MEDCTETIGQILQDQNARHDFATGIFWVAMGIWISDVFIPVQKMRE
jgi:hypothetical protein